MDTSIRSKRGSQTIIVRPNAAGVTITVTDRKGKTSISIFRECLHDLAAALWKMSKAQEGEREVR